MKSTKWIVAALSVAASFGQDNPSTPPSGWVRYGMPITVDTSRKGFPNWAIDLWGVGSQHQEMVTVLNLNVYKNAAPTTDGRDYYLITGPFRHAVSGSSSNVISVGWYGKEMFLTMEGTGLRVWDFGPSSSVGETTTGFTVGGSISSSDVGANFAYSVSNTMPDVKFNSSASTTHVNIKSELPGGKKPASLTGYSYTSAIVLQVNRGAGLTLTLTHGTEWRYNYPIATVAYRTRAWASGIYDLDFSNKTIRFNNNLCAGVRGNLAEPGQPVELQACVTGPAQQWTYTVAGQLRSALSQEDRPLCLDTANPDAVVGTGLVLATCNDAKRSQKFQSRQVWMMAQDERYPRNSVYDDCVIYSPTSFTVTATECHSFPGHRPQSRQLNSDLGFVVGPGATSVVGAQLTLQGRRANATFSSITGNDRQIVNNSFLTIR